MIIFDDIIKTIKHTHGVREVFKNIKLYLNKSEINYINLKNGHFSSYPRLFERLRECDISNYSNKYKIFHSTYYRVPSKKIITFNTVHDFVHEKFKKNIRGIFHSYIKKKSFLKSDVLICISNYTKGELLRYYEKEIINSDIKVIHNGISQNFYQINDIKKKNFILFVGRREKYKNFTNVVKALSSYQDFELIFTGGGELNRSEKYLLENYLPKRYKHLKFIEQEELNILYNTAFCLIYPSLQEGFGLPVVEAQTAGCPVIAVNASSIPEISNHAAILMENGSIEEIRHSISELNIGEKKMKLVEDGLKNSKKYKWDVIMNDYIKLYKRYM